MAINATTNWYVRASGNVLNGGGFDSAISGAGTNFADQDSPQLSPSDLATPSAGSTTLTSVSGGFTSAMIGNCIRIASGTNFTPGYYFITARTDTNTVTLDRTASSSGAGASGVGRVGGAFATLASLHSGGTITLPTITTPLAAGHVVNIRGSGGENPASADYTSTGYFQFPAGNFTDGLIVFRGYNGRPRHDGNGLTFWNCNFQQFENLRCKFTGNGNPVEGFIDGNVHLHCHNVWVDQNGIDQSGIQDATSVRFCRLFNTGTTTTGTGSRVAISTGVNTYNGTVAYNVIEGWRGGGMSVTAMPSVCFNVIANCRSHGIVLSAGDSIRGLSIQHNSIYNNTGDGIRMADSNTIAQAYLRDNILEANTGFGINCTVNATALNDRLIRRNMARNFFFNNTSGNQQNKSAGDSDVTLSGSAFTNAAAGDFTLNNTTGGGASVRSAQIVFPGIAGTGYPDGGAIQSQPTGGGGLIFPRPMNGGYSA
jgi:hypothetical protein